VPVSEPSTLLTDYLLAAVAAVLAARLWIGAPPRALARRLWAVAFLVGAGAAAAGGTVHGFTALLSPSLHAALWAGWMIAAALCGGLLVAGASCHALRGSARRIMLTAVAALLIAELGLLSQAPLTRYAVWAGAIWIVWLLALVAWSARTDPALVAPLAVGLALAGAALVVQRAGFDLAAHFNHNDLSHVLLTAALWPIHRVGLRLERNDRDSPARA